MPDSATPARSAVTPTAAGGALSALGRAFQAVVKTVKAAAGVFAPGHVGELTRHVPFELVNAVLEETGLPSGCGT
jgi:hypothetical protein